MKKAQLKTSADRRLLREKLYCIVGGAFVLVMLAALVLLVWQKTTQRVDTSDYDGKIVDRWADYVESKYGSQPRFRLLVESDDGKRFTVKVDPNVYESAKVGMRIKSRAGKIVVIDSELKQTGSK